MNYTDLGSIYPGSSTIISKIVWIVGVMLFTILIGKLATIRFRRTLKDKLSKDHLEIILKIIQYSIIIAVIGFIILPVLGIQFSSLLVAGSIAGIVIGFASQNIVSNLISGLFLMVERPIKVGDSVNINGLFGIIENISIISTTVRSFDGLYIRIPNEKVFTNTITNFVANAARRFEYVVGIEYKCDADKAINIIKDIIEANPLALKNPAPQVFVDNLGDNAVNIIVRIWAPSTDWYSVKTETLWIIKKTLGENEIEIAFPQRTIWFGNELENKKAGD